MRLQLFEFIDLPWFPGYLRDLARDHIHHFQERVRPLDVLAPELAQAVAASGSQTVIDLCSGGGGQAPQLIAPLRAAGAEVEVLLTDLYPHPAWAGRPEQPGIRHLTQPVDATDVPAELVGARTLFNAFHHLPPPLAAAVLADAAEKRQPLLIAELSERSVRGLLLGLFPALLVPISAWRIRPLRWDRVLLSTLIPILPAVVLWDGVVSALRAYTPAELRAMTEAIDAPGYRWEIEVLERPDRPARLTWLRGMPVTAPRGP